MYISVMLNGINEAQEQQGVQGFPITLEIVRFNKRQTHTRLAFLTCNAHIYHENIDWGMRTILITVLRRKRLSGLHNIVLN